MPRQLAPCLLATILCALAPAAAAAGELEPARIVLTREASAASFYIAVAAGYFQAEGLDPRVTFVDNDALASKAVASGDADFGMASLSAPFYSYAATHNLKIIASRSSDQTRFPLYALEISGKAHAAGFTDVRGLRNARIALPGTDGGPYYALFSIATRFELDPQSIKTISLKSSADELEALSRGEADAAVLPYASALHDMGRRDVLLPLSNLVQWQQGVVFTSADTTATRRGFVEKFIRAYQRGTTAYQLNFLEYDDGGDFAPGPHYDEYLRMIARETRVSPELLAITKPYCDRRANLDVADIEKQVRFWQDQGRLDKTVAAADLLDLSFIGEESVAPQTPGR